jgi:hypothetical protein
MLDAVMRAGLIAGLAWTVAIVPAAAQTSVPTAASAPVSSNWDDLAGVVIGSDETLATSSKMLDGLVQELLKDASFTEMEGAYPGLMTAFTDALRPIMREEVGRMLPQYRADLAALYADTLTVDEAGEALRFMTGPAMTRFRAQINQSRTTNAIIRDVKAQQDVSAASLEADARSTALEAMLQMQSQEMKDINAFYRTPLGMKLAAINPRKLAIDQKWSNHLSPEAERMIEPAVFEAMISHVAKTDPEIAEAMREELAAPSPVAGNGET